MIDELELPDFLDRKRNGLKPDPLPRNVNWKPKGEAKIVWPRKAMERAERERREAAKQARQELAKKRERNKDYTL